MTNTCEWIADLVITFENGSIGAKTFTASSRHNAHYDADSFVTEVIQYARAKQKNLVKSHRVTVKEVK